ncbi:MAG: transposase [Desulfobulbaceae bacterium]|nr:transposase [Desulfobulbaceae bacterium]
MPTQNNKRCHNISATTYLTLTLFFTVLIYLRHSILCDKPVRDALREAIAKTRTNWPFVIDAWVLLPEHLHCIWTLPPGDADFSTRWNLIKRRTSQALKANYFTDSLMTASKLNRRELTFWQRRYWEHRIRDERDFEHHVDYIHYNPVNHGHATSPRDWCYSSIHRYVENRVYPPDWGVGEPIRTPVGIGHE